MKKIAIIGSSGSGKSTLAKEIKNHLNMPLYHLDALHWKPGWVMMDHDEKVKLQKDLVSTECWIIDGNYASTLHIRLEAADTIIILDLSKWICLYRAIKRTILFKNKSRPDMALGNKERFDWHFLKYIYDFPKKTKPRIMEMIDELENKRVIVLKSKREVKALVKKI
jgi:adenylate kinase family enzyme